MIARLREALYAAGYEATPEEIAEILWLATRCPAVVPEFSTPSPSMMNQWSGLLRPRPGEESGQRSPAISPVPDRAGRTLYPAGRWNTASGPLVSHTGVPVPTALPNSRALGRALRPLRSTVRSGTTAEIDIDATIDEIAEGTRQIVLRAARELLFDATLVVDAGESMAVWHDTAAQVFRVLHRLRAFNRSRLIGMNTDLPEAAPLTAEPFRSRAPTTAELRGSRHLVLVLTDGVGEAWHSGAAQEHLARWASTGPVAVLQVLPEHMWPDTGLPGTRMLVKASRPAIPNSKLVVRHPRLPRGSAPVPGLPIPVLDLLTGSSTEPWARLMSALDGHAALPVIDATANLPPAAVHGSVPVDAVVETDADSCTPEEALTDFLGIASSGAQQLAAHLACVAPLTIPLMRLVQYSVVPNTGPVHLAEVFLAGLMLPHVESTEGGNDSSALLTHRSQPWDRRLYTFPAAVIGDALRELIRRSDERATHELVTAYLARHREAETAGMALMTNPHGVLHTSLDVPPLARIDVAVGPQEPGPDRPDIESIARRRARPPDPVEQDPQERALGIQAPYFFLSYVRSPMGDPSGTLSADDDKTVLKFYQDLCRHIRHLTDLDPNVSPGFLDRQMAVGTRWSPALKNALATCQTFVPLYEPRYFRSTYCGYEWACFEARQALGRRPGSVAYNAIIPVLMVERRRLPDQLPPPASDLQYTDRALPPTYHDLGIWGLLQSGRAGDYRRTTLAIARHIVEVADTTRVAPCSADIFDEDANAFADFTP